MKKEIKEMGRPDWKRIGMNSLKVVWTGCFAAGLGFLMYAAYAGVFASKGGF